MAFSCGHFGMWPLRHPSAIGTRWLRAAAQGSTLLGVLMVSLVWSGLNFHQAVKHRNAERGAVQDSENLARAFEEHLRRSLRDIDRSIKTARSRYIQQPDELDFRRWLRDSYLFDDQTVQMAVIGPNGRLKLSNIDSPSSPKTDLSDREHFKVHLGSRSDDLFISKPVIGRTSGKWSVQLSRRIENADGSFGGVIVASLDPDYLASFYNSVDIGIDGYVRVIGADGIVRATGGATTKALGLDLSTADLFKHYPREAVGWYYNASNRSDGIPRLVAFREVNGYPLIVTVGLSKAEIFSEMNSDRYWHDLFAAAITALTLLVVGLSIRARWLREKMAEERRIAGTRLEQTRKFLDTIIENVPVPIVVKERDTLKFVLVNQAYEVFIGLPRDRLIGKTVFDLFPRRDAELITTYDLEAVRFNKRLIMGDFQAETPKNGVRVVNTTRLVISDEHDEPEHLIVVIDDVTEKREAEERIAHMAHHDPLTDLPNRAQFNERLADALAQVERGGQLALLLLDLDRFKQVNDTHGHLAGDELLKAVAGRLRGCVRETDFVARLGGDEFIVIQTAIGVPSEISALADRMRAAITAPYDLDGIQTAVGVSIGISFAPDDASSAAELMRRADLALYRAKRDGRDTYRFFEPEMDARDMRRALGAQMRKAI
jgi:diguanylate cyclase (GGDEF)-like protein/PAS domain S-box-containing protein